MSETREILDSASLSVSSPQAWRIGSLALRSRILPAPMCNISDRPFREILREFGADLVYTQMISAEGLVRGDKGTWELLDIAGEAPPVAVQLLGSNPDSLARAAQILEERGAALVDLNMGCPARKVTGNMGGSALMRCPELVAQIVRKVKRAISVPFTVKMRAGWDEENLSCLELAKICEAEGADAVTLHARTRQQGYKGRADWSLIARLKESVSIPVIGNGDVTSPADAVRMIRETHCDAVMIGRGLIGNPWLLRACEQAMNDFYLGRIRHESEVPDDDVVIQEEDGLRVPVRIPYYMRGTTLEERLDLLLKHTRAMVKAKGERRGVLEMRKHAIHYIRGLHSCKALRERLMHVDTLEGVEEAVRAYRAFLSAGDTQA
ncbi:MAG: tRNA dihydrouridine synthase DusB [Candidatus Hydrogenedentota bacterium]|uniref:tRNA-dihydrouridine synthase n=1 Tax=Sumerlaea chitinivorans TaxID=2250252 RepID=A0A2Z4Y2Q4_SUMC1|nr:tRNA dihydrouridine synthase B [Candidatus Sumerlaea chitinivorans]MCX7963214.1 tRNA dihydrouridine synthase DusB [Candidatus Sumerlaea chitinivorans]RMH30971.1 MAG: tRNA dihydrouridine synthase DusB [Candidatus Hydrogenedentota bacterium]GIX45174.1 MAG: tRNA-dihydrouridine synthase [Candidatus Sumerlaea sp.]